MKRILFVLLAALLVCSAATPTVDRFLENFGTPGKFLQLYENGKLDVDTVNKTITIPQYSGGVESVRLDDKVLPLPEKSEVQQYKSERAETLQRTIDDVNRLQLEQLQLDTILTLYK